MTTNVPRSLPFSCWDEWINVKNGLFSSSNLEVSLALDTINLWRVRGRMPLSADSTAQLIELRLRDSMSVPMDHQRHSESELKLLYSAVTVRAVNGLVDPSQQGIYATSVLTLAERIGLPGWIVELRHDATHNLLPSLSVLRTAASTLVNWFYDFYWIPQLKLLQTLSVSSFPADGVANSRIVGNSEGASSPDSSPTFVSEVFVPFFIASTIKATYAVLQNCTSAGDNKEEHVQLFQKETLHQSVLWMPRLKELCRANPHAVHAVVLGLLRAAGDALSSAQRFDISKPQAERELKVALFWLTEVLELTSCGGSQDSSSIYRAEGRASECQSISLLNVASVAPFVECLMGHIQGIDVSNQHPPYLDLVQQINTVVSRAYCDVLASRSCVSASTRVPNTVRATASNDDMIKIAGKRKSNEASTTTGQLQSALKRPSAVRSLGSKDSSSGIVRIDDYPMWPLGCLPAEFDTSGLYLVEEVL